MNTTQIQFLVPLILKEDIHIKISQRWPLGIYVDLQKHYYLSTDTISELPLHLLLRILLHSGMMVLRDQDLELEQERKVPESIFTSPFKAEPEEEIEEPVFTMPKTEPVIEAKPEPKQEKEPEKDNDSDYDFKDIFTFFHKISDD